MTRLPSPEATTLQSQALQSIEGAIALLQEEGWDGYVALLIILDNLKTASSGLAEASRDD